MRRLTLFISEPLAGRQVRTLLRRELGLSAAGVRRAKDRPDGILLDGQPVFTNVFVQPGQVLSVAIGDVTGSDQIAPVPGPLAICYEDEDLLIVNKPGDLAVHPSLGHHGDTLANFLMAHYAAQNLIAAFHSGRYLFQIIFCKEIQLHLPHAKPLGAELELPLGLLTRDIENFCRFT